MYAYYCFLCRLKKQQNAAQNKYLKTRLESLQKKCDDCININNKTIGIY